MQGWQKLAEARGDAQGEAPKRGCAEGVNGATPLSQDSRDVREEGRGRKGAGGSGGLSFTAKKVAKQGETCILRRHSAITGRR